MKTVTVTIGRNILGGTHPMPAERWHTFASLVREAVSYVTEELWAVAPTKSGWNGTTEEGRVFYGPLRTDETPYDLQWLRARLSNLATYFMQEAIGLSVGESELVESWVRGEEAVPA